ncbi:VRRNUC domain containing protein, partial [Acanthamoeba castellanii str. Neff]
DSHGGGGGETCECYWWRRQGNESRVFPSREALDLYERALALANSLEALGAASSSTPAPAPTPTSSATVSTAAASSRTTNRGIPVSRRAQRRCGPNEGHRSTQHHRSLLETLVVAASFLAHSASSPEQDPYSEIIRLEQKQQLAERSRRKRFSSAAALLDSPFPSILHQLSSAFPLPSLSSFSSSASALQPSPPPQPLFTSSLVPTVPVDARRRLLLLDDGREEGGACAPDDEGGVVDASAADQPFPALFGRSCLRKCASAAVWRACIAERPFLSRFTHGWVLARVLHDGVGVLEKQKKYAEAAACLRLLLSTPFCPGKRGHWWHRLSLNVEHMGRKKHSLILAETALNHDQPSLRLCDQLVLQKRVLKLAKPPLRWNKPSFLTRAAAAPLSSPFPAFSIASLKKPRSTTIYGRLVREEAKPGKKSTFVGHDGSRCTVEELALQYYAQEGRGWAGMHSENGIFKTLFGLLMWDVLFADVPGVFLTPFQVAPMDLATDAFATSRRSLIEQRLQEIRSQSMPKLLAEAWIHYGTQCLGVDWRYSLQHLQVVASCIGGNALANIFQLLAEDYKGWGHGLPDLLLWNEDGTAKLVEVKGPRDQLSAYQQVWLDQLLAVGVDCEVCFVLEHKGPTGHKRKRPSPDD